MTASTKKRAITATDFQNIKVLASRNLFQKTGIVMSPHLLMKIKNMNHRFMYIILSMIHINSGLQEVIEIIRFAFLQTRKKPSSFPIAAVLHKFG